MARRCGCASDTCSCTVVAGDGIQVVGTGSAQNPFIITSLAADIETGIDIQQNNTGVANNVHGIDFRGNGVTVSAGVDEVIVTITDTTGGGGGVVDVPAGVITMFGGSAPPTGWLLCNGQTVATATYPGLFGVISTTYGGDATNFRVPDLRDLYAVGIGPTHSVLGGLYGNVGHSVNLSVANLPPHQHGLAHTHTTPSHNHSGISVGGSNVLDWASNAYAAGNKAGLQSTGEQVVPTTWGGDGLNVSAPSTANSGTTGSGSAVSTQPRSLALNFIIKT